MIYIKILKNIDSFIAQYPKDVQAILEKIRKIIKEASPEAEEVIAYGIPTFRLNGKNLVHFSAFKNHIGFFPTPSAISAFKKDLEKYKTAKGSVQFPLSAPIPYDLIKKIVVYRVKNDHSD